MFFVSCNWKIAVASCNWKIAIESCNWRQPKKKYFMYNYI